MKKTEKNHNEPKNPNNDNRLEEEVSPGITSVDLDDFHDDDTTEKQEGQKQIDSGKIIIENLKSFLSSTKKKI